MMATVAAEVWMRPCDSVAGTLHAVGPGLEFQAAVDLVAGNERDDFLEPPLSDSALPHDFDFPAHLFGVAAVHAEKIAAEEAASSPPVPARISRMMFFSSSGSVGRERHS